MNEAQALAKLDGLGLEDVNSTMVWAVRPGVYAMKNDAVQRLAAIHKITCKYSLEQCDLNFVVVKAIGFQGGKDTGLESFGEARPENVKGAGKYFVAMAEKRAHDRVVLKILDIYGSFYSDAENSEWEDGIDKQQKNGVALKPSHSKATPTPKKKKSKPGDEPVVVDDFIIQDYGRTKDYWNKVISSRWLKQKSPESLSRCLSEETHMLIATQKHYITIFEDVQTRYKTIKKEIERNV